MERRTTAGRDTSNVAKSAPITKPITPCTSEALRPPITPILRHQKAASVNLWCWSTRRWDVVCATRGMGQWYQSHATQVAQAPGFENHDWIWRAIATSRGAVDHSDAM